MEVPLSLSIHAVSAVCLESMSACERHKTLVHLLTNMDVKESIMIRIHTDFIMTRHTAVVCESLSSTLFRYYLLVVSHIAVDYFDTRQIDVTECALCCGVHVCITYPYHKQCTYVFSVTQTKMMAHWKRVCCKDDNSIIDHTVHKLECLLEKGNGCKWNDFSPILSMFIDELRAWLDKTFPCRSLKSPQLQ